ncbi:hypothetical protein DPMN_120847 [Dreissena polymorpha]|uniref:Uncharacterized protein n=1 Tax=Dreissena polymorpha TaxID=45954 RepID=A0A9D4GL16_DREPO|nr:hypothetical protein DPMN_120847 [Dreissena polymorpha]
MVQCVALWTSTTNLKIDEVGLSVIGQIRSPSCYQWLDIVLRSTSGYHVNWSKSGHSVRSGYFSGYFVSRVTLSGNLFWLPLSGHSVRYVGLPWSGHCVRVHCVRVHCARGRCDRRVRSGYIVGLHWSVHCARSKSGYIVGFPWSGNCAKPIC